MHTVRTGLCPVCGYELGFPSWQGKSASDEICPCCYIQFGYDDWAEGDTDTRQRVHEEWRKRWIDEGMKWHSKGMKPTEGWNPIDQLRAIGVCLDQDGPSDSEPPG
jgi:hypothetical protein